MRKRQNKVGSSNIGIRHLAKAMWLIKTRGSTSVAGPTQSKLLYTFIWKVITFPHCMLKICWGKQSWLLLPQAKANAFVG